MNQQTWAQLSNGFVYGAMTALALAMFAYAAELAFGTSEPGRPDRRSPAAGRAPRCSSAAGPAHPPRRRSRSPRRARERQRRADQYGGIGLSLTVAATALLLVGIVCRGFAAGRAPWGNMYEFSCASRARRARRCSSSWPGAGRRCGTSGVFVVVPALLTLGLAVTVLYVPAGPLVPALQLVLAGRSTWPPRSSSGAVFTVGGVVTVLYLVQDHWERRGTVNALSRRLPPSEQLDQSAYRLFAFVFPLWTFAIVAGAIWAENAWGRTGAGTPRRPGPSSPGWCSPATCTHARRPAGRGARPRTSRSPGSRCFVFNYFGVNIWFSGLHSYGGLPHN